MKLIVAVHFLVIAFFPNALVANAKIETRGSKCVHGLHQQPGGGPFSVFLFCDDGAGSNIGVMHTKQGGGPGAIKLSGPQTWKHWSVGRRFWQETPWAIGTTSFAWSPDLKFLYVATDSVSGEGGLFKLDLVNRKYTRVLPKPKSLEKNLHGYEARITGIHSRSRVVTVEIRYFNGHSKKQVQETIELK